MTLLADKSDEQIRYANNLSDKYANAANEARKEIARRNPDEVF